MKVTLILVGHQAKAGSNCPKEWNWRILLNITRWHIIVVSTNHVETQRLPVQTLSYLYVQKIVARNQVTSSA